MKLARRLFRYRIRTLLFFVTAFACFFAAGLRMRKIHHAARLVEANGGDVWLGETLYSGDGFGFVEPRTKTQQLMVQAKVVACVLLGQKTQLWTTSIPEQHNKFLASMVLLNASQLRLEVIHEAQFDWLKENVPDLKIGAVNWPDSFERDVGIREVSDPSTEKTDERIPANDNKPLSPEEVTKAFERVHSLLEANPQLTYRLDRYDPIIGYPMQSEMGALRDTKTGKVYRLPWPK